MLRSLRWSAPALALGLGGCAALGSIIDDLGTERPPAPLDQATVASDARLDSLGRVAGSFVGEGTRRQVHLLSSDTTLIADLARRSRPDRDRRGDIWQWLATRRTVVVPMQSVSDPQGAQQGILVGSPDGHTPVRLTSILLHGSSCGWRGTQAEFLVDQLSQDGPWLRGPVVGAFFAPDDWLSRTDTHYREPVDAPSEELSDSLLGWTSRVMDSLLTRALSARDRPLSHPLRLPHAINGLDDENAADVLAFRLDDGRIRYGVSLREDLRTERGIPVQGAIVMVWDASGTWQQVVFRPTLLEYRRGRPSRAYAGITPPLFWRRLAAVSGFAFKRDYLWMEQMNVEDGSVLWVILEPRGNTVVAAAEMDGPC
jgi:hypothetical protein